MEEYGNDIVTLKDDDGKEYTFEVLDAIETDRGRYVAFMPVYDEPEKILDESGELVIAKVMTDEAGEEYFEDIADDDEYETVADAFVDRLSEIYDIDEQDETPKN